MVGTCVWRARGRWRGFGRDRRGAIALMAALATPVVLMSAALGIEVAHWSAVQIETQRVADMAAIGGGVAWVAYSGGSNLKASAPCQTPSQACVAAVAAANVAERNGASGASSRSWSWNTTNCSATTTPCDSVGTLADGAVMVVVSTTSASHGVRNSSDPIVKVTVQQAVPLGLAQLFKVVATETLGATAIAEITTTGPQPCLAALNPTGTGITYQGSTTVKAIGCSVRSNANITETGSGYWDTEGIYAAGTVSLPSYFGPSYVVDNNGNPIAPQSNAGTISDPYASNQTLQQAFVNAAQPTDPSSNVTCPNPNSTSQNPTPCSVPSNGSYCTSGTGSGTCTLVPGNYGSFNVTSGGLYTFNLQPGMYYFNGNINLTNDTETNGNGVTIITTGTFTGANSFYFNVNAPTPAQVSSTGGIAGIALAGTTTGAITVSGDPHVQIGGVMYFPNASFSGSGSTSATGSASENCFELIAGSITLSGYSGYAGDCPQMGATTFGSVNTAALVQ